MPAGAPVGGGISLGVTGPPSTPEGTGVSGEGAGTFRRRKRTPAITMRAPMTQRPSAPVGTDVLTEVETVALVPEPAVVTIPIHRYPPPAGKLVDQLPLVPVWVWFDPPVHCDQIEGAFELIDEQVCMATVTGALELQISTTGSFGTTATCWLMWNAIGEVGVMVFEPLWSNGTSAMTTPAMITRMPMMRITGRMR